MVGQEGEERAVRHRAWLRRGLWRVNEVFCAGFAGPREVCADFRRACRMVSVVWALERPRANIPGGAS